MAGPSNALLAVVGLLVAGAASAIFRKVIYQMSAPGWHGEVHTFEKPWFTTFMSTTTCSICLLLLRMGMGASYGRTIGVNPKGEATTHAQPNSVSRTNSGLGFTRGRPYGPGRVSDLGSPRQPLLASMPEGEDEDMDGVPPEDTPQDMTPKVPYHDTMHPVFWQRGAYGHVTSSKVVKLISPAVIGHFALILQGIGLQYTSASINQMVSGSCIIFTAMLSVAVLKRKLTFLHKVGVGLSMVGVVIVSLSSLLPVDEPASCSRQQPMWLTVFGIVITLLSQVIQAVQLVLEELMLRDLHLHPFQVLGWEGVIGMIWMVCLATPLLMVIPGTDAGHVMENTTDTLLMLWNSPTLAGGAAFYWLTVLGTNVYGVLVTATIGSVFRSVLLTTRTALVWVVDLVLFYTGLGGGVIGESLHRWSGLEVLGFVFLLAGTLIYARGSQNIEKALERAVIAALSEASVPGGAQTVLLHSPPPERESLTGALTPISQSGAAATLLVRQVPGLNSLLESDMETNPWFKTDTGLLSGARSPLGVSVEGPGLGGTTVLLEGLDSNTYAGSSSYFNPFIPRLPLGEDSEVPDIMGTSLDADALALLSPHPALSCAITPQGASPRGACPPDYDMERSFSGRSVQRNSLDGTTVLLQNVRASLSCDSARPSATGISPPPLASGVTQAEEDAGQGFHMDA